MLHNIYLSTNSVDSLSSEFNLDKNKQITTNDYIEIPSNIKNFEQLKKHEYFLDIQAQYIYFINELSELYYHFTGLNNKDLPLIINQITNNTNLFLNDEILFYSYKIIRQHVYNIINYLTESKDKNLINDETSIICTKLTDCFGICFEGFNSKILRIGEYISSCNNINQKINFNIKNFVEETIDELLIKYKNRINIHEKNALLNIAASYFNFNYIHDKYANLSGFDEYSISDLICEVNIAFSGFNICKLIVENLYFLFEDIIIKSGKKKWLDNYIEDITAEYTFYIEDYFINIVNKYLDIELEQDKLSITDLISLTEKDKIYITNIKDKLHFLCAKYIDKSLGFHEHLKSHSRIIAKINHNIAIFSVNNKYFYIVDNNNITIPIQLNHLELINPYSVELEIYISMLMQAIEQTFSTATIYHFFNAFKQRMLLFSSSHGYFIRQELTKLLKTNNNIRNRILSALLEAHLKGNVNNHKICRKFIKYKIIDNELLKYFINNKVDISSYLIKLSKKVIYYFVISLDVETIENIILNKQLYNSKVIHKINSGLYYLFIKKRWEIITLLLQSKIKFYFIESLNDTHKKKALTIILNNRQYNIAEYFLLDYIKLNITDNKKQNIIHHIILHNQLELLKIITNNICGDILHKLLICKSNEGLTPLTMSMLLAENITYFNMILSCCNDDVLNITNDDNNVIMLAAQDGHQQCLQKLIAKTSKYQLLTTSNRSGYNSLMLAIKNKHDICANIIFDKITKASLRKTENISGYTVIHLAILHNSKLIEKLINKADDCTLNISSYARDSILSIAVQQKNEKTIELILNKCGKAILYYENSKGFTPIMIAASSGYLNCLKKLFEYSDERLLLKQNNKGDNILMVAVKNAHLECVAFLLQNCKKNTLKRLYRQTNNFHLDILYIAQYRHEKLLYLDINKKYEKITFMLNKYKPYCQ